jgi:4-hydroxy-2-oxoheptanedioate aldolase
MSLRKNWDSGNTTFGVWLSIPSSISAEAAARSGLDYVCVDMQHGVIDYSSLAGMVQAIELGGAVPIARVPWNEPGIIGKSLDAGAHGVVVPMVNTREQAEAVIRSARYAPEGARSWGPVMPNLRRADNRTWAHESIACIPMIETVEAIANLDDILSVPGIDAIYVGPADLSISLGLEPGNRDGDPLFDDALATIVAGCRRHGVVPGIHTTGALAPTRLEQGFRMITVTADLLAMTIGLASELAAARGTTSGASDQMY